MFLFLFFRAYFGTIQFGFNLGFQSGLCCCFDLEIILNLVLYAVFDAKTAKTDVNFMLNLLRLMLTLCGLCTLPSFEFVFFLYIWVKNDLCNSGIAPDMWKCFWDFFFDGSLGYLCSQNITCTWCLYVDKYIYIYIISSVTKSTIFSLLYYIRVCYISDYVCAINAKNVLDYVMCYIRHMFKLAWTRLS